MKRSVSILIGLVLLTVLVFSVMAGRETAVASPETITVAATSDTAWRYQETYGVTEEPFIVDTDHLNAPYGVTIDGSDNLWITEIDSARVLQFDSSGVYQRMLGQTGIRRGYGNYLSQPIATAVDSSGNAWVTDRSTSLVKKYDGSGSVTMTLGEEWVSGSDNAHFDWPHGVAVDSNDNLYVSDRNNHRIQIFNSSGVYLATIGETGVTGGDNTHLDSPIHIDIDSNDRLYIADSGNQRVQIFDVSNLGIIGHIATLGTTGVSGSDNAHFEWPDGVTAVNGKIYVADLGNQRVQIFNAATYAHLATLGGSMGPGNNQFQYPIDVAVDSSGSIYVADISNRRVQVFNNSYAYVRTIGVTGVSYLTDENHYYLPNRGDATQDGGWLVAERDGHRVIKLNADGSQAWTIGEAGIPGEGDNLLNLPHDAAEQSNKVVFVIDTYNNRVVVYGPDGNYLLEWGGYGTGDNQFSWPTAVAFGPNGDIYVVDTNNRRVQIYDFNYFYKGTLGVTGEQGSDNAHFKYPLDVAVAANGDIFVADEGNNRIQVFNSNYAYKKTIGVTGDCNGNDNNRFCGPSALDFDGQGRLYVADTWHQRIQIFDAAGNYLDTIGGQWGGQPGQFRSPQGVTVSASGQVLISDTENHRLQIFEPFVNTWSQSNVYGFGNGANNMVMGLEVWGDSLFASVSNWAEGGSVWWYDTSVPTWTQVSQPGFSATYTATNPAVIDLSLFNNQMYASTGWGDGAGQLWRSSNGTSWTAVNTDGFGNGDNIALTAFGEFNGYLYLGTHNDTTGAEIWRSQTGNSNDWTRAFSGGGDTANNQIVTSLLEFDGYFYVSLENDDEGVAIWRTNNGTNWSQANSNGFGDANNIWIGGFSEFDGYLYIGTRNDTTGGQLWRSGNGTVWHKVIGDGFGDLNNTKIESAVSFNDALFVATTNVESGMEVWRSEDGLNFVQMNRDGFDGSNTSTLWNAGTAVFQNELYIGTQNDDNGGGVWLLPPNYNVFLPMIVK